MPLQLWENILEQLSELGYKGTFSPHFYNEPLLDDELEGRLELVRKKLPEVAVLLFSNFTLMDRERFRRLDELVDRFFVSIDEPVIRASVNRLLPQLSSGERSKIQLRTLDELGVYNRAGTVRPPGRDLRPVTRCRLPADYLVISADGNVHLCYNDFDNRALFGNVAELSISEIWWSEPFLRTRCACCLGELEADICSRCLSNRTA